MSALSFNGKFQVQCALGKFIMFKPGSRVRYFQAGGSFKVGGTQEHYKDFLLWEQLGSCQISSEKGISLLFSEGSWVFHNKSSSGLDTSITSVSLKYS